MWATARRRATSDERRATSDGVGSALEEVASIVLQRLVGARALDPAHTAQAIAELREHMGMRRAGGDKKAKKVSAEGEKNHDPRN